MMARPIRAFRRICKVAGIEDGAFRIHDIRHAWCSLQVNAGIPLEIVSQGARHSSPIMTRRYAHAQKNELRAANDKVAELLLGVLPKEVEKLSFELSTLS